jgi:hypothetical protein
VALPPVIFGRGRTPAIGRAIVVRVPPVIAPVVVIAGTLVPLLIAVGAFLIFPVFIGKPVPDIADRVAHPVEEAFIIAVIVLVLAAVLIAVFIIASALIARVLIAVIGRVPV